MPSAKNDIEINFKISLTLRDFGWKNSDPHHFGVLLDRLRFARTCLCTLDVVDLLFHSRNVFSNFISFIFIFRINRY